MTASPQRFFETWEAARDAFRTAAAAHPHVGVSGAIEIVPGYTLDYAWTGEANAARVLVYSSGLHGIEGYVGGAVQCELLSQQESQRPGEGCAVLWLHSLNPWGMAHGRRVNESNVDLNRNFLPEDQAFEADDDAYDRLAGLLNPTHLGRLDPFYFNAALQIARHGLPTLRNAVARGQYSRPDGIFFGGNRHEATTRTLTDTVLPWLAGRERVVWIDLHSGRGARGDVVAFVDGAPTLAQGERAQQAFGDMLHAWEPGSALGYEMRGGMLPELARRHGTDRLEALTVEFGTAGDIPILKAMRAENWLFHHGPASDTVERKARGACTAGPRRPDRAGPRRNGQIPDAVEDDAQCRAVVRTGRAAV